MVTLMIMGDDDDDNKKDNCDNIGDGNNGDDDHHQQQSLHAQHLLSHDACTTTSLTSGRCVRIQSHNCNCKSRPRWVEVRAILTIILGSLDGLQLHNCIAKGDQGGFQARHFLDLQEKPTQSHNCNCKRRPMWVEFQARHFLDRRALRAQSHNCNCKRRPRWVEVQARLTIILGSLNGLQSHNCKRRPRWVKFQDRWTRWVKLVSGISWTCRHSPHNDIIANWPWCRSEPWWLDIQGRGKKLDQWQGFNNSGQATFYAPMKSLRCQSGSLLTDVLDIGWVLQILKLWQGTLTLFMFASLWWRFFITKVWKLHFS